ncbi:hypothetical protein BURPS1106B_1186 [Burkholderia pseudomallei 1106b]|uniref:Uncharacterized protein n=1 Tax=Burkholderia pseudomallei 1710a TaxID=320371 RepID=A0A0E1W6J6_BURPE|nr:hypothetical protein BURPS668_A0891 [Burkholderia pseudomallei 668]EEH28829.1 conserved hypothetical protein [Burkholderia pseudomallei Pakistan 9]EEP48961.1 conserved hypothetical protein [Burkholderia pseudomallei MSHR346]EES21557.1 hypothetical protein BURPS1106B_1186 [Burkholderia pseudomallei 1106b]EET05272.1 hypothetical protein BURPS1710A_A3301 [Burkholderia pseudomallei 1710a]
MRSPLDRRSGGRGGAGTSHHTSAARDVRPQIEFPLLLRVGLQ